MPPVKLGHVLVRERVGSVPEEAAEHPHSISQLHLKMELGIE